MKFYSVTDGYIDFIRREHAHVYSNKELERSNTRKYIGVVLVIGEYNYFVPLSSPKPRDCKKDEHGKIVIQKDTFTTFRIIVNGDLHGTIQFANMIPVPPGEVLEYDPNAEKDAKYKDLVLKEMEYVRKNEERIQKRAAAVYRQKIYNPDAQVMRYCLDFQALEDLYDEWCKWVSE